MGLKESGLRGSLRSTSSVLPAFFDVTITNTNSPVQEGDILTVDYSADNTGDAQDTQDIRLEIDSVEEDRDSDITLLGAQSTTGTLEWDTPFGDETTYSATVLSDDDSDSVTVEVESVIPDSAIHYYDAAELDLSDGESVTNWADLVGNEDLNDVGSPTYRTNGLNGNPSVEIDGSGDAFEGFYAVGLPCTMYMVIETNDDGSRQSHFYSDSNVSADISARWDGNEEYNWRFADSPYSSSPDNSVRKKAIIVIEATGDNELVTLRVNGDEIDSLSSSSSDLFDGFYWGADQRDQRWTDGYLAELLITDQVDSDETGSQESRLSDKWDISLS